MSQCARVLYGPMSVCVRTSECVDAEERTEKRILFVSLAVFVIETTDSFRSLHPFSMNYNKNNTCNDITL